MYAEWGGAPSAGVVTGIGTVAGRRVMIIANDATVKAGAFFPMTCKKVLRAQRIAMENRLPLVYLVDSAGVFLPLQDEVFPDEDDFGRIFRNNAVISAAGIPQFAAIMGNCVAGGGYLPVLCDKLLMTEGSGLYLAGPALVKAAIGQAVESRRPRRRGDARRDQRHHRLPRAGRRRVPRAAAAAGRDAAGRLRARVDRRPAAGPAADDLDNVFTAKPRRNTTSATCCRASSTTARSTSTRPSTARRWCAATAGSAACRSASSPTRRKRVQAGRRAAAVRRRDLRRYRRQGRPVRHGLQPDRACRSCSCRTSTASWSAATPSRPASSRPGRSWSTPSPTASCRRSRVILGGSFGAGNYALCGKAFDPRFIFAWPTAKYAVMGGDQAASTLLDIQVQALKRAGNEPDAAELRRSATR